MEKLYKFNHLELHLNDKKKILFKKKLSLRIKNEIKSTEQIHNKVNKLNYKIKIY